MFKRLRDIIQAAYEKQIDGTGLAIFRIAYSLVLLGEIAHLFYYRHLIFDKVPYLIPGEIDLAPALIFWAITVFLIIFGLATRVATIINYVISVVIIGTISTYEYHMFYTYLGINAMLMFMPVSRCLSIDRLFTKLKYSNTKFTYTPPTTVSSLNYLLPVFVGVGLVYFDSIFHKLVSDFWMRGLGMWLPSVMPQCVFFDTTIIMNIKWLVVVLGYLTFLFEVSFLFVFWRKKWRFICFLIGLGLHLGILICYPIPFFALGVVSIYLLLVPVSFWRRFIFKTPSTTKKTLIFYYDYECPLCVRTKIVLLHFGAGQHVQFIAVQQGVLTDDRIKSISLDRLLKDIHSVDDHGNLFIGYDTYIQVFNRIWCLKPISWAMRLPIVSHIGRKVYSNIAINRTTERCTEDNCGYEIPNLPENRDKIKVLVNYSLADLKVSGLTIAISAIVIFQFFCIYNSPLLRKLKREIGVENNIGIKITNGVARKIADFTRIYLGVTQHGVFMDTHFYNYNHSIGVVYIQDQQEVWLPLTEEDGKPGNYLIGHNWVKYTFRVNSPNIDQEALKDGIRDFTSFWAHKNGISLHNAIFEIRVKKNLQPTKWEKDFLKKQLANPWLSAGSVHWKNNEFEADIAIIENL